MANHLIDITNKVFGEFTVIKKDHIDPKDGLWFWKCQCLQGHYTFIKGYELRSKRNTYCSKCYPSKNPRYKELFSVWQGMVQRCKNKNHQSYKYYGGRGIKVCERWYNFHNFAADMPPKPIGYEIDRINNNGNYEPSNCRWITPKENSHNNNHTIKDNLEYKNISRQYRYQLRKQQEGKCIICGKPREHFARHCNQCYIKHFSHIKNPGSYSK